MRTLTSIRFAAATVIAAIFIAPLSAAITRGPDAGGYTATDSTVFSFVDVSGAGGASVLSGSDDAVAALTLPFPFSFYGQSYSLVCVSSNGALYFVTQASSCSGVNDIGNVDLALTTPNDWPAMFPFWTDLTFQAPGAGSVFYQTVGAPGNRRFIIQWNNALPIESQIPVTFEIVLAENTNTATFQYKTVVLGAGNKASGGGEATVGIRNSGGGSSALEWSFNAPVLHDSSALLFSTPLAPVLTLPDATVVYDGSPHAAPATLVGVNGEPLGPLTITYNGNATAPTNAGSYNIVASYAGNGTYTAISALATLTISQATPVITWANPADIAQGTALSATQLNATANVAGSFVYTPPAGTQLSAGTQTLSATFTPSDAANYTTATAMVSLTVTASNHKIVPTTTFTGAPDSALVGTVFTVAATTNASTTPVITATGSCSIAGVTVTITTGVGVCHLKAEWAADSTYRSATDRQSTKADKRTPVVSWAAPAPITYGAALDGTQLNATANVPGTFAYTPPAGRVLPGGTHTLTAKFTPTNNDDYTKADATVTIVVNPAAVTLTWDPPASIVYGDDLGAKQLKAKASVGGSFVYSPPAGTVLPAGVNTLTATFTPNNTANYTGGTVSVTLTVTKATPKITWPKPDAIVAGTPLGAAELNATTTVAGVFVYSPIAGTVLPVGNAQLLSVTFTPADGANYNAATDSVTIRVKAH